ncbi:MAG: hypothetical protein JSU62_05005 [Gammaproteobacteria bacterium]|jgi:hypothetical protein|nr:MAG: hypothetical protein JSU62_05005 [Gammaproteobacteria bacterium]
MLRFGFLLALSLTAALPPAGAVADTLLIDSTQSAATTARPAPGASMDQVLQRFGEPQQRLGPVGEPPISHWVYPDFIVYFEHDRVIHAVVPRR